MNVVIATCEQNPSATDSDQLLVQSLERKGAQVCTAPWNSTFAPFSNADLVIVRSTWDYFEIVDQFYAWLNRLENSSALVGNSVAVLKWNAIKTYLSELEAKGVRLIPTLRISNDASTIQTMALEQGWEKAIIKPLVSGTAKGLSLVDTANLGDIERALIKAEPLSNHGLMLQPFCPTIKTEGEYSLIYIAGQFSHAVRKTPKQGDFRIQSDFGGQYSKIEPNDDMLQLARTCLHHVPGGNQNPPLYARVDGVKIDDQFHLMELELTEPELMFKLAPDAADFMATKALEMLS